MSQKTPTPKRGCFARLLRWSLIALAVVIVLIVLINLTRLSNERLLADLDRIATTTAVAIAALPTSTETAIPTITPTPAPPTDTPSPTATPLPTLTSPPPTATPLPATATSVPPTLIPTATPWYSGGTLHKATWAEWKAATHENRMATAADMITNVYVPQWKTVEELETLSTELVNCMDELAATASAAWGDDSPVADIAVTCILIMME